MNKTAKLVFALSLPFLFPNPSPTSYVVHKETQHIVNEYKHPENMSLEEKIGQLIISSPPSKAWKDPHILEKFVKENNLGGVIYFGWDLKDKTKEEIKEMSDQLQSYSGIPLLIGADIEGGLVNRIKHIKNIPSAEKYGRQYENALVKDEYLSHFKKQAAENAILFKELGIDLNFGPVLDLKSKGTFKQYGRCYSEDPRIVAELAGLWIQELQKKGIKTIAKHFPGHGNADKDSHDGIAAITKNKDYIEKNDLVPFYEAIKKDVSGIMLGYLTGPYDSVPAPFSNKTINVLKNEIGYNGLIITDDLNMPCVKDEDHGEMAVKAIKAGVDIILDIKASQIPYIINAIKTAVQNKEIDEKQIDYSVYKILKQKGYFKNEA